MTDQALRAAREAAANNPAVHAAYIAANARLFQNLGRLAPYRGHGNAVDVDPRADYDEGLHELVRIAALPQTAGQYHINYDFIQGDPYLEHHNQDINIVMPNNVTDPQFAHILATMRATNQANNARLGDVFNKIDRAVVKHTVRKRVKRLFDSVETRMAAGEPSALGFATLMHDFTYSFDEACGAGNRCIDGIQNGLTMLEQGMLAGQVGGPARHIGDFISSVFADYKRDFIFRHRALAPTNLEFPTMIVQNLSQIMLYSMGLRGANEHLAYPNYGYTANLPFRPTAVMRRFLQGEQGLSIPGANYPDILVNFEAFNVDKMVQLLHEAWTLTHRRNAAGHALPYTGVPASRLTEAVLMEELVDVATGTAREPVVGDKFIEFSLVNMNGVGNEYFDVSLDPTHPEDFRLTREFWLYMLRKYNYILP